MALFLGIVNVALRPCRTGSYARRNSGYVAEPAITQPDARHFIIGGAFPVIHRLAQLALPEERELKMRLLLSRRKREQSVPACLNQNKLWLMAVESHKKMEHCCFSFVIFYIYLCPHTEVAKAAFSQEARMQMHYESFNCSSLSA